MEAILLGKPVITLGNVFYNSYKNILSLKNTPRAKWCEEILKYMKFYKFSNEDLVEYLAKIVDQSERLYFIEPKTCFALNLPFTTLERFAGSTIRVVA